MENKKINSSSKDGNNSVPATTLPEQEDELHYAVLSGDVDLVKSLLEKPETDVNAFAKNLTEDSILNEYYTAEVTPLIIAIKKRNLEIVKLLVNHPKINVNLGSRDMIGSEWKRRPLIYALEPVIFSNKSMDSEDNGVLIEITKVLLNRPEIRVNISSAELDGTTLFEAAVIKNCPEIVKLLIDRPGVEVNLRSWHLRNKTPIEYAIYERNPDLLDILLKSKDSYLGFEGTNRKSLFNLAFERLYYGSSEEERYKKETEESAKVIKLIFAKKMSCIDENIKNVEKKQEEMLKQKKMLKDKRKETYSTFFYIIDELMKEYFPEDKPEHNMF